MKWRELFYVRKSDRQVLLILLTVVTVALIVLYLAGGKAPQTSSAPMAASDSSTAGDDAAGKTSGYYRQPERTVERFPFDPNTADSTQLLRLGLQPWQVRNIYKYRAAGGVYRQKEDFARLYGLTVKQYRELEPYIAISDEYQPASTLLKDRRSQSDSAYAHRRDSLSRLYPRKIAAGEHVDLNVMDTTAYRTVPGIGSYYAGRIMAYGRRLGGYVSVSQLDEIEDFPPTAKAFFAIEDTTGVQKIYVNRLSLNELKRHPYISYLQAKAIVDYRRQNGPIRSLDDLRLLRDFPSEAIARLRPYVSCEE